MHTFSFGNKMSVLSISSLVPNLKFDRKVFDKNCSKIKLRFVSILLHVIQELTDTNFMPTENYQTHNIYQYKRKTCKNNRNENSIEGYMNNRVTEDDDLADSPRSDRVTIDEAGCSCDIETDGEIANILHKKCRVIALAQQQLQKILDGTDKILSDNANCCRSVYDLFCFCKQTLLNKNNIGFILVTLIIIGFIIGLIIGSATCGTTLRNFNSPILTCIENLFLPGPLAPHETFKAIV